MRAYIFFPYKGICGHIYGICGHIYGSAGIYMASAGIYIIYMPADPYICPQMPYICPHMTSFEGYIQQYSPQAWIFWISKLCIVGGFWAKNIIFLRNISGIYIFYICPPMLYICPKMVTFSTWLIDIYQKFVSFSFKNWAWLQS